MHPINFLATSFWQCTFDLIFFFAIEKIKMWCSLIVKIMEIEIGSFVLLPIWLKEIVSRSIVVIYLFGKRVQILNFLETKLVCVLYFFCLKKKLVVFLSTHLSWHQNIPKLNTIVTMEKKISSQKINAQL